MRRVRLDQVSDSIEYGVTASATEEIVGPKFLRITDIQNGSVNWATVPYCEADERKLKSARLEQGDIVFARTGATTGKSFLIRECPEDAVFASYLIRVRASDAVDPIFLSHFFDSRDYWNQVTLKSAGAAQPGVNSTKLKELEIPLPPLEEQRRIAGILDQADALRRLRTRALDKLNTLGQAIFHEMFGDLRDNPFNWPQPSSLGEIANVVSGITKGRKTRTSDLREVPYLAVANVQDRHLKLDVVKTIEASETEIDRFRLQKDDILLTEGGDPDKLGRGTLWNDELAECIHQNHVFRVRVETEDVRPTFLSWQIGSPAGKAYFLKLAKQTTGIASINKTQLKGFPVLQPPLPLQLEFEQRLAALAESTKSCTSGYERIKNLFTSLQHRAFRGEL